LRNEKDHLPKPEFGKKKRFPGINKKTNKPYPGVNHCAKIPLYLFKEDEGSRRNNKTRIRG
jgi:hypothetical protein